MYENFSVGDTVRVKGVRSPKMLVIDQVLTDDETVYSLLWFDADQCARQIQLRSALLEASKPDSSTFGMVPVYGVAN